MVSPYGWRSTVMKYLFLILSLSLIGCPDAEWEKEVARISKEDAFNRCNPKDRETSLPEGTVCRPAVCAENGGSYFPRGICEYNAVLENVYCSPIEPNILWCADIEDCIMLGSQAFCEVDRD